MNLRTLLTDEVRLLTFRRTSPAIVKHWRWYLTFGLVFTWLAGIGRYWDNPRAHLIQHLGLGSVAYVFCLALIVWLLVLPLRPRNWSYWSVLVFVTLTSPPAVLYAIPVERFMDLSAARSANAWFLTIVAIWRVSLLAVFLRRASGLSGLSVMVACLLPIVLIIVALAMLNLEHVVFDLMGGFEPGTANDTAYLVVFALSYLSVLAAPFLLIGYVFLVFHVRRFNPPPDP